MQAAAFAAQGVIAGAYDIVVAGGIEHMTRVPMGVNMTQGPGFPFPEPMVERYSPTGLVPQGISAETVAERWKIGREELDQLAYDSHMRAHQATIEGRFAGEIVPITVTVDDETKELTADEGIRPGTSLEKLASLAPAFQAGGVITAGNSSQISDGAAAALIMGRDTAEAMGLRPRARFVAFALAGVDPVMMLEGPIPATAKVLAKAGLVIDDIDLFEVNEAFSSVIAAWLRETGVPWDKVNVNGGAMANGHPLGASGGKLLATLLNELERRGGTYGLQTMCEGGGMANATIIERL
jgi:acetyl-CoA acetyltransferase family protein